MMETDVREDNEQLNHQTLRLRTSQYLPTVGGRITRGWDVLLSWIRAGVGLIPAHLVSSAFYMLLAPTLMHLHYTEAGDVVFGARVIEWLPWQAWPTAFFACGWILAQQRDYRVYIACHVPAAVYGLVLVYGILSGGIGQLGWLAVIYLVYGVVQGAQNTLNERMVRELNVRLAEVEMKQTALEELSREHQRRNASQ